MAKIVNTPEIGSMERITDPIYYAPEPYDPTYGNHDIHVISSRFKSDDGGMSEDVADDIIQLKSAANSVMKKRRFIYDWKTKNASFLELHADLRRLGIKNNAFFLALYDKDLQGINVYDPALPLDIQIKIYLECVINPWYYLREVARIPAPGSPIEPGGGDQYQIDRANLASWYCYIHHIDTYVSKPRQTGKTQDALQKINYAYHFGSSSSSMLLFNKDLALSKENLARIKDQRDLYPTFLQMRLAFDEEGNPIKGTDNITAMKNPVTNNTIKVMPCANSAEAADRLGRGYTAPIMMYDEIDFENYNVKTLLASGFAYSTASKNAIKNQSMSSRLLLSTPGDLSTRDGKAMTDYIRGTKEQRGMFVWNDRYYDEPISKIRKEVQSTRYNGFVFIEYSWKQLKKSMEWYEQQCNICAYNQEMILREINLERLAGSSQSPFTREQQLYLSSHKRKPISEVDVKAQDTLSICYIYEKMDRRIPYIIGIDPSDGLSEDNNAMIVINPLTYKVAAEYKCPYISPKNFSKFICDFMDRYCPHALIVVEANRGRDLLQRLTDSHYASRVWYDKDRMNQLLTTKTDQYGGIPQSTLARKVQGFVTGPKSRNYLFATLENMVMENIDCIYTENLVNEILTLIRKPTTGKIEAAQGEHDDCVMAYLIALYVYFNASNLGEFGISRHMRAPGSTIDPEVETEKDYRSRVRSSIAAIPDKYKGIFEDYLNERDPIKDAHQYAREIAQAQAQEKVRASRPFNVQNDGMESFEGKGKKKGKNALPGYHSMGYQHMNQYAPEESEDEFSIGDDVTDIMDDDEYESFQRQVLASNFRSPEPSPFQPGSDLDDYFGGGDMGGYETTFDPDDYT